MRTGQIAASSSSYPALVMGSSTEVDSSTPSKVDKGVSLPTVKEEDNMDALTGRVQSISFGTASLDTGTGTQTTGIDMMPSVWRTSNVSVVEGRTVASEPQRIDLRLSARLEVVGVSESAGTSASETAPTVPHLPRAAVVLNVPAVVQTSSAVQHTAAPVQQASVPAVPPTAPLLPISSPLTTAQDPDDGDGLCYQRVDLDSDNPPGPFYVVTKGKCCGIWDDWLIIGPSLTANKVDAVYVKVQTWASAVTRYRKAKRSGVVVALDRTPEEEAIYGPISMAIQ